MSQSIPDPAKNRQKLTSIGQSDVLRFYDRLDDASKKKLLAQLAALDLDNIAQLAETHVRHKPTVQLPRKIEPVKPFPHVPADAEQRRLYSDAEARGNELLKHGKIGAFLVAGGQG